MPSYSQYKRQLSVLDADDVQWITVKGNHIPIKEGQSKEEAVKSFFESKKDSSTNTNKESKYDPEFEVVRKNALANGNVYGGKYTQKSKAEAYKEYKNDTSSKENMKKANEFVNGKPEKRELNKEINDIQKRMDEVGIKRGAKLQFPDGSVQEVELTISDLVDTKKDGKTITHTFGKLESGIKNGEIKVINSENKGQTKPNSNSGWIESPKFEKLTEQYMPKTGEADNELGETLRSINRIVYRYYNDGDIYNKGYGKETVNWAVKHLSEVAKNKNTPKHIARGIENGLYEMKTYGLKDKDRYETALKILTQTMEFASKEDIESLSKIKRSTKKATDSWHKLWGKK